MVRRPAFVWITDYAVGIPSGHGFGGLRGFCFGVIPGDAPESREGEAHLAPTSAPFTGLVPSVAHVIYGWASPPHYTIADKLLDI